jgi:hypothetical protein
MFQGNGFSGGRLQRQEKFKDKKKKESWFRTNSLSKEIIMMKSLVFAMALLSLALAGGCAKGGNGVVPTVTVSAPNGINPSALYPGQTNVTFTATTTSPADAPVTWSLTGTACTGSGNPCGTIDPTTGVYQAPATAVSATVTATLQSDAGVTGKLAIAVIPVTVVVTPLTVNVGQNLVQQFTAVAVPDDAPQTFTWNVTCSSGTCGSLAPDPNNPGAELYTAPSSPQSGVQVMATSTVPETPAGVGTSKVTVAASRLPPGAYGFRFSGYDSSGNSVAVAGSLTASANGTLTGGVEDVVIDGVYKQYTTVSGSYVPSPNNSNDISNNLGTLTLSASGGPSYTYTAVLTSSGTIRMIESSSDGTGITGSGVMQKSGTFNIATQAFVFGFTGVDSSGNRVGYAGLLPMYAANATQCTSMNGIPCIAGGLVDSNDNGTAISYSNVTGTYQQNGNGVWQMSLTLSSSITLDFDFYVSGGATQTKTAVNPLTLYAISTDPVDATHPALSGNMVYQVPLTYNNAAFSGTSVSNLTGVQVVNSAEVANSSNVSLTVGTTDGTSAGTGGAGGFTGTFDQNDNGTITSVGATAPFSYTYVATSGNAGRYTFQMLGNPNASPVVSPLTFVLYASGANRGFLLDQNSMAVMTGSMEPQLTPANFSYTPTELPGPYAAATIPNCTFGVTPVVQNLLLTSTGSATYVVTGTQNTPSGSQSLGTGSYTLANNSSGGGTGTITLPTPVPPPSVATNVIYAIDASLVPSSTNAAITDFFMMGTTSGTPSSLIFAQQ